MPKKQSTAAQRARQRQADTGENYTTALRAQTVGTIRHQEFSTSGAGWAPIIERAERKLDQVWPGHPKPLWEEKFGDLCWKYCPADAPSEVRKAIREAEREASLTCQTCPSPGRKRVVWTWDADYGWIQPWWKTCCDACYYVPLHLRDDESYLYLLNEDEESS